MTFRALPSSADRRSFSRRSRAISLSRVSAGGRPAGLANAARAPWSRWMRHAEISDVYRPSRRSRAPLPALSNDSYSSRIRALYAAEYVRDRALAAPPGQAPRCSNSPGDGLLARPRVNVSGPDPASADLDTEGK